MYAFGRNHRLKTVGQSVILDSIGLTRPSILDLLSVKMHQLQITEDPTQTGLNNEQIK